MFARANRLKHRPRERIIELVARLQFNRQMGEASGQALNPRWCQKSQHLPSLSSSGSRLNSLSHARFRVIRGDPSRSLLSSGQIGIKESRPLKLHIVTERLISQSVVLARINFRREKFMTNKFFILGSCHSIRRQLSEYNWNFRNPTPSLRSMARDVNYLSRIAVWTLIKWHSIFS